jgi:NMD protein affecting ribosome stability and mRNA decay
MGLKTRFCAKCGKETAKLHENVCANCYVERGSIKLPPKITVQVCPNCDSVNWKGVWIKSEHPHEYYLQLAVVEKLDKHPEIELENAKILQEDKEGRVELSFDMLGKKFTQILPVELYVTERKCLDCIEKSREVHEATLQLRTSQDTEGFILAVMPAIERYKSSVLKIGEQRMGIDVYMSDKYSARHLASELKKQFKLKMKETYEEYSWDQMKNRPKTRACIMLQQL